MNFDELENVKSGKATTDKKRQMTVQTDVPLETDVSERWSMRGTCLSVSISKTFFSCVFVLFIRLA